MTNESLLTRLRQIKALYQDGGNISKPLGNLIDDINYYTHEAVDRVPGDINPRSVDLPPASIEYCVVREMDGSDIEDDVRDYICNGWRPVGGLCSHNRHFCQAMVRGGE